ncbi:MAG TPA: sarcosine oxidase subunit gamma family protein [Steroidobacteraceae bacterium]|nr:sarcosine oxidase subunit gamma family protein [Steroidobacteraceae bacterium]
MADLTAARSSALVSETAWLRSLPAAVRWVLRGDEAVRAAAQDALGVPLPEEACRAGVTGERAALWLGPDEWLLVAPAEQAGLALRLERSLARLPHSLVDVSHRQVALLVHGSHAATVLAGGCPLDLDLQSFPVGMCTRTVLGKAEVVLWRTDAQAFRLEVWRSFAPYVAQFLAEASRGII